MFKESFLYKRFFKLESKSQFNSYEEAYQYLYDNVFQDAQFVKHVTKASEEQNISYVIAYELISNHLTQILYEVDKAITRSKKKSKIIFHSYFSLQIGFMLSTKNKKMFLEKFINLKNHKDESRKRTDAKF